MREDSIRDLALKTTPGISPIAPRSILRNPRGHLTDPLPRLELTHPFNNERSLQRIDDYALHLFNEWGIGHKEDNRGLLVLLSMEERKARIEVGRGFETLFPDERAAAILAEMIPDLKVHHYGQALLSCTKTLASAVAQERHVQLRSLGQ